MCWFLLEVSFDRVYACMDFTSLYYFVREIKFMVEHVPHNTLSIVHSAFHSRLKQQQQYCCKHANLEHSVRSEWRVVNVYWLHGVIRPEVTLCSGQGVGVHWLKPASPTQGDSKGVRGERETSDWTVSDRIGGKREQSFACDWNCDGVLESLVPGWSDPVWLTKQHQGSC